MPKEQRSRWSGCPIAFGLDIFGDKWTLLVLRDLLIKKKSTFREFLASPERIATNVLADRLDRLEQSGLVTKALNPDDARRKVYATTRPASDLFPFLMEMVVLEHGTYDQKEGFQKGSGRLLRLDKTTATGRSFSAA
jgi:DNA-binding HxlR family transcriptional regulator